MKPIIINEPNLVNQEENKSSGFPHSFDTGYAIAYGCEEAIMIKHFQYFITANANRGINYFEGRTWTFDRLEDFCKHFPYWTIKQVRRILNSLIRQGVIIRDEFNAHWSNRTQWYAFKNQDLFIKTSQPPSEKSSLENTDLPKWADEKNPNGKLSDAQMGNCINETSSNSISITSNTSLKVPKPEPAAGAALPAKAGEIDSSNSSKSKKGKDEFSSKVHEIAQQMIEALIATNPEYKPPKNLTPWLIHIEFMLRLDERDPKMLMAVFRWALSDSFWCATLFKKNPPQYFRGKFDQLYVKMNAKPVESNKIDRRYRDKDGNTVDDWKDRLF